MKITPEAQNALNSVLKENEADGLQAVLHQTCCGASPVFQMVRFEEGDQPEMIDGISVLMDEDTKDVIKDLIIDVQDGNLVVLNPVCGCGGGCGGGDHDCDDHGCGEQGCCH